MSESKSTEKKPAFTFRSTRWKVHELFSPYPRVHTAPGCEYKGNCLTAEEATEYIMSLVDQELERQKKEAEALAAATESAALRIVGRHDPNAASELHAEIKILKKRYLS